MEPQAGYSPSLSIGPGLRDSSIKQAFYQRIFPSTSLDDASQPLVFNAGGLPGKYYDLKESFMYLQFKVKKADDTNLLDTDDIAVLNLFPATCFQELQVFLNETLVSSTTNYPQLAYLKAHLSYPKEYKTNNLLNSIYMFDDTPAVLGELNGSFKQRKELISQSRLVEATVPLFDDIFEIQQYLYPDVRLKLKLQRSAPKFCLVSSTETPQYKITFDKCVLYLKKINVDPGIYSIHEKLYESNQLTYPYNKSVLRVCNFAKDVVNATAENIFNSQSLPEVLCIGFITTESYNGKINRNPQNFNRHGVTNIQVLVNNQASEYTPLNLSDKEYLMGLELMFRNLGLGFSANGINRLNYTDGNCFYVYKLYPTEQNSFNRSGSLTIQVTFAGGAGQNTTAVILGQAESMLTVGSGVTHIANILT